MRNFGLFISCSGYVGRVAKRRFGYLGRGVGYLEVGLWLPCKLTWKLPSETLLWLLWGLV